MYQIRQKIHSNCSTKLTFNALLSSYAKRIFFFKIVIVLKKSINKNLTGTSSSVMACTLYFEETVSECVKPIFSLLNEEWRVFFFQVNFVI